MKNVCLKLAVILAAILLLFAVPSEWAYAEIEVIPIDQKTVKAPDESYYVSDTLYDDPSLQVIIEYGRFEETDYVVARVRIATASQLRSFQVSGDGEKTDSPGRIAQKAGAVLALSGDFYKTHLSYIGKHIVRQGVVRMKNAKGDMDILVIDDAGDLHIFPKATSADIEAFEGTIVNCYSFGPAIVTDGVRTEEFTDLGYGAFKPANRSCICQTGPLEYMFVASAGPDNPGSKGLTIDQFADLVVSLGNVKQAYNLDGGSSAAMVFHNQKINSFGLARTRSINDIIYFASAWQE